MIEVYIRYLGDKVCLTRSNGKFLFCEREELTPKERKTCDNGGGYVRISETMLSLVWS